MSTALTVGIIGDYNPHSKYHLATNAALQHAAQALGISLAPVWLPTPSLEEPAALAALDRFDALWCSPGSPYDCMQGALNAIQFAREKDRPFVGT